MPPPLTIGTELEKQHRGRPNLPRSMILTKFMFSLPRLITTSLAVIAHLTHTQLTAAQAQSIAPFPSAAERQSQPPLAAVAQDDASLFGSLTTDAEMSSLVRQAPLVFPAAGKHTATVIFVHGLGDTGMGWASAVQNWRRRQRLDEVKFVLPHAPQIPITCNRGMPTSGWFDIVSRASIFDRHGVPLSRLTEASVSSLLLQKTLDGTVESLRESEDEAGILTSNDYFQSLVQAEVDAGISANRIVLGGFSQGGAMAIFSGLTCKHKIAGIVGLSCWLLLSDKFASFVPQDKPNQNTPVFMAHGDADALVRPELGALSMEALKKLGYEVSRTLYPGMEHSACLEELDDVEEFLLKNLPLTEKK